MHVYIGAATVEAVQAAWPLVENLVDVRKYHAYWSLPLPPPTLVNILSGAF